MNILIAEDAAVNAILLRNILERAGHRVLMATNGTEALTLLEEHPETDLVATDIVMPEMDGIELVREIRARPELEALAVMFITSVSDAAAVQAAVELKSAGYILKPILEPSRVVARVESVLSDFPVVLRPEEEVRRELGIDGPTYRSLLADLSKLVQDARDGIGPEARTRLLESAQKVGAQRLVRVLDSDGNPDGSPVLGRELKALMAELEARGVLTD